MWILVKIFEKSKLWSKFLKISISVKILGVLHLFKQSWFGSKFKKLLILVKTFENVDFVQNFRKILISVKIF